MSRFDFRVKLDLYKYYQDARRFCWVFVDGTTMPDIARLKGHITKLLDIQEPFYLMLNDHGYLPSNEDIRILKENEKILVVPGTGFENQIESLDIRPTREDRESDKRKSPNNSVQHKEIQTVDYSLPLKEPDGCKQKDQSSFSFNGYEPDVTGGTSFHTTLEGSEAETTMYKTMVECDPIEDYGALDIEVPIPKKKRVRKRKQKSKPITLEEENRNHCHAPSKPKIISTCTIPMGKHIRFVNSENGKVVANTEESLLSPLANGVSQSNGDHRQLSALLSLGKNSTPLTFTSTSAKKPINEEIRDSDALSDIGTVTPEKITKPLYNDFIQVIQKLASTEQDTIENFSEADAHKYPTATAQIGKSDIIAFKMLKMGEDYTPQVSNYIVAQVLSPALGESAEYHLKILRGSEEVQTPIGKFTLMEESDHVPNIDTIQLNYTDLMQPLLIHSADSRAKICPAS